ncbi:MAG: class I SAM-dependent methyltransferase [Candidatus Micrarchaeota archaeon]
MVRQDGALALIPELVTPMTRKKVLGGGRTDTPPVMSPIMTRPLDEALRTLTAQHETELSKLAHVYGVDAVRQRRAVVGMQDLFDKWAANGYDGHMKEHDLAVRELFRLAIAAIHRTRVEQGQERIFKGTVLEGSCGTGSVIRSIIDIMQDVDPEGLQGINFIANDLSSGMQDQAKEKLADARVTYTQQDLRELSVGTKIDVAILSQTLHLLVDPELLERERVGDAAVTDHRQAKTDIIKKIFDQLGDGGFFILVDEWPAKLSRNRSTLRPDIEAAFEENFRPINSKADFRDRILANVPGARFVTELKIRIDLEHSMTLFLYQKDPLKLHAPRGIRLPSIKKHASKYEVPLTVVRRARIEASQKMFEMIQNLDRVFVERYRPVNGERKIWDNVRRIADCPPERIFDIRNGTQMPSEFDVVLMADVLHQMSDAERQVLFSNAVRNLGIGGAMIVMDLWKPPAKSPYPVSKRDIRNTLIGPYEDRLLFEGAIRIPVLPTLANGRSGFTDAEYAWVYRKLS